MVGLMYSIMPRKEGDSTSRKDSALSTKQIKSRSLNPSSERRDISSRGAKKVACAAAVDVGEDGVAELG